MQRHPTTKTIYLTSFNTSVYFLILEFVLVGFVTKTGSEFIRNVIIILPVLCYHAGVLTYKISITSIKSETIKFCFIREDFKSFPKETTEDCFTAGSCLPWWKGGGGRNSSTKVKG